MEYWKYHDVNMRRLLRIYKDQNSEIYNRVKEAIDTFKIDDIYAVLDYGAKKRLNTYILEWKRKKLLKGDFGERAEKILNRNTVTYRELLELFIYKAYLDIEHDKELDILRDSVTYYFIVGEQEAIKENKGKKLISVIPDAIFLALLDAPTSIGYSFNDYMRITTTNNANQLYRNIISNYYNNLDETIKSTLDKQLNNKININEEKDKISGQIDNISIGIENLAKIRGILEIDPDAKYKFVAVQDERTTKMCKSLDGQIFSINGENKFKRYSKETDSIREFTCKGMVVRIKFTAN